MKDKLPVITALAALSVAVVLGLWLRLAPPTSSEPMPAVSATPPGGRSVRVEERLQMLRESYARQQQRDAAPTTDAPTNTPGTRARASWHAHDANAKVAVAPPAPPPVQRSVPAAAIAPPRVLTGALPTHLDIHIVPAYVTKNTSPDDLEQTILHGTDRQGRLEALEELGLKEPEDALRVLNVALLEENLDPEIYAAVIGALSDYVEDISPDMLAPALRNRNANVRFEAVSLLGDMDTAAARTAIQGATNDEDPEVRELAKGILEINH